ncbi:MAG: hypothetical protein JWP89_2660 [Schlesneria sp.]|nr:hypothetical protein [Schlesneria sp.]
MQTNSYLNHSPLRHRRPTRFAVTPTRTRKDSLFIVAPCQGRTRLRLPRLHLDWRCFVQGIYFLPKTNHAKRDRVSEFRVHLSCRVSSTSGKEEPLQETLNRLISISPQKHALEIFASIHWLSRSTSLHCRGPPSPHGQDAERSCVVHLARRTSRTQLFHHVRPGQESHGNEMTRGPSSPFP